MVYQIRFGRFFIATARVHSVLVPYFCEDGCKQEDWEEVAIGDAPLVRPEESKRCPFCGERMVLDGAPELYEGLLARE